MKEDKKKPQFISFFVFPQSTNKLPKCSVFSGVFITHVAVFRPIRVWHFLFTSGKCFVNYCFILVIRVIALMENRWFTAWIRRSLRFLELLMVSVVLCRAGTHGPESDDPESQCGSHQNEGLRYGSWKTIVWAAIWIYRPRSGHRCHGGLPH